MLGVGVTAVVVGCAGAGATVTVGSPSVRTPPLVGDVLGVAVGGGVADGMVGVTTVVAETGAVAVGETTAAVVAVAVGGVILFGVGAANATIEAGSGPFNAPGIRRAPTKWARHQSVNGSRITPTPGAAALMIADPSHMPTCDARSPV